jgi:DNA-binding LytR/AlgR family response regulator
MLQAIAIDDEPPALSLIELFCKKSELVNLKRSFTNGEEALQYLKKHPIDLVFLDIQMPAMLGTELRKQIDSDKAIVFTTAFSQFAAQGFDLDATDFLLKPYSLERFVTAIDKVKIRLANQLVSKDEETAHIVLRADYSLVKIAFTDINYIEGLEDYSKFYFTKNDNPPALFRITMKSLVEKLPSNSFFRIQRSYIVNAKKVEKIRGNTVFMSSGEELPIGRLYKNEVTEYFKKLLK